MSASKRCFLSFDGKVGEEFTLAAVMQKQLHAFGRNTRPNGGQLHEDFAGRNEKSEV